MNKEIGSFIKKYKFAKTVPTSWFNHFVSSHLYKTYYQYLDGLFTHYNKTYKVACVREMAKYRKMKKSWESKNVTWVKAA
jgi:hypothetical protein